MIYVASPYTHSDKKIEASRYDLVSDYCAKLIIDGYVPFSPIVYCHLLSVRHILPGLVDFWWDFNLDFMRAAKEMHVLQIDGWQESKGVRQEIEWWISHKNTRIHYTEK